MGKTRDLLKKIRGTKGTFYAKMGKKDLNDTDNHDGVITHLESDILSVKSSGP